MLFISLGKLNDVSGIGKPKTNQTRWVKVLCCPILWNSFIDDIFEVTLFADNNLKVLCPTG